MIVGGAREAALALQQQVHQLGERACMLPVEVASHTPLMSGAAAAFAGELEQRGLQDPAFPVIAGISAQMNYRKGDIVASLARQIAETIRWMDCMDACAEAGVTVALELGPGTALSRMMQARHPGIQCRSVAEFRSVAGIAAWVERQFNNHFS
jgi:[acyl-carrier-protein] S-malonyltransferase